ncbi:hypothetical protein M422DRAFT_53768 [Sphaerobolus stellatus SS14]|uniref:Uncharacterized protein n=1 Tax=Sphaerobolus stellatus (strain SS14) TaxID=990650 RepID=A0A0C9TKY9_SPHS4|nr:hypothetical protein M422DRAFT_53768 [Sphaerobolus stellatus SS14]
MRLARDEATDQNIYANAIVAQHNLSPGNIGHLIESCFSSKINQASPGILLFLGPMDRSKDTLLFNVDINLVFHPLESTNNWVLYSALRLLSSLVATRGQLVDPIKQIQFSHPMLALITQGISSPPQMHNDDYKNYSCGFRKEKRVLYVTSSY